MPVQEPQIVVEGMSNDALYAWMEKKVLDARLLKIAYQEREMIKENLRDVELRISNLIQEASITLTCGMDTKNDGIHVDTFLALPKYFNVDDITKKDDDGKEVIIYPGECVTEIENSDSKDAQWGNKK